jgi:hypothetical protein
MFEIATLVIALLPIAVLLLAIYVVVRLAVRHALRDDRRDRPDR